MVEVLGHGLDVEGPVLTILDLQRRQSVDLAVADRDVAELLADGSQPVGGALVLTDREAAQHPAPGIILLVLDVDEAPVRLILVGKKIEGEWIVARQTCDDLALFDPARAGSSSGGCRSPGNSPLRAMIEGSCATVIANRIGPIAAVERLQVDRVVVKVGEEASGGDPDSASFLKLLVYCTRQADADTGAVPLTPNVI